MTPSTSRVGLYKYQIREEVANTELYSVMKHTRELIKYIEEEL